MTDESAWSAFVVVKRSSFKMKVEALLCAWSLQLLEFSEVVSDEALKQSIAEILNELGDAVFADGAWRPEKILLQDGSLVDATAFMGRHLVPRRVSGKGPAGQSGAQRAPGPLAAPPEGHLWLSAESGPNVNVGDEVDILGLGGVRMDDSNAAFFLGGRWYRAELVKALDVDQYLKERLVWDPPAEDARTLAVDFDEHGERFKGWRQVVAESREYSYHDWPWEGPMTVLHTLKQTLKQGGNPKQWLLLWSRAKGVQEQDRVMHELRTITEALYQAGVYDQLNMACLSCFEVLCRRLASIVDAYAAGGASAPDWGAARYITNIRGPEDIVAPQLRAWAAKRGKEEVELANARAKIKDHRRLLPPDHEEADSSQTTSDAGAKAAPKMRGRGRGGNVPPAGAAPTPHQEEVFLHIENLARDVAKPRDVGDVQGPEAALTALLKGRGEYHAPTEPVSLAPFNLERVSLPESLSGVLPAAELLPEGARRYLDRPELMLKEDPPTESFTPYWDPCLLHSKRDYVAFIRKLMSIDFLLFTAQPKEHIGIFFVHKSDGKRIRLIVDARAANRHFLPPPGVDLCTAEGFSRIEVILPEACRHQPSVLRQTLQGRGLHFGLSDVKDAFHRLRQPFWLAQYFCMRPLEAHYLGLTGATVEGRVLRSQDKVYPIPGSLCMGFTWSLYFCQVINEAVAGTVPRLVSSECIRDRGAAVSFDFRDLGQKDANSEVRHYVYVDNLGVVSPHEAVVRGALEELDLEFTSRGLLLHPGEVNSEVTALGIELDGSALCARISSKRFHKVRQAIKGLLRRRKVSGRVLEVIVGHATFCSLLCRPLLSVFNAVYKYIQSCYFNPSYLWDNVRQELITFAGAMIFLRADWWRSWSPYVTMTDASKGGYGVCCSTWPEKVVSDVGRVGERSRFRWDADSQAWLVHEDSPELEHDWQIAGGTLMRGLARDAWTREKVRLPAAEEKTVGGSEVGGPPKQEKEHCPSGSSELLKETALHKTTDEQFKHKPKSSQIVSGLMDSKEGLTPATHLEQQAVNSQTQQSYVRELKRFTKFAAKNKLDTSLKNPIDHALVQHMNVMYSQAYQSYHGDRLMASVMHRHPSCGRLGGTKLPRAWRALKGWRKLCPGRTRDAYPLAVWAAVAALLVHWGLLSMAVFVMVAVSSYARPSELLNCRKESLVRPASQVTNHWSLLLAPEAEGKTSKTGLFDVSVILDSPFLATWSSKVFAELKKGMPSHPLWNFTYVEYARAISTAAGRLGVALTPYHTRHSGPSIDRSRNYRSQLEVQRRGQWKSTKSVHRYEKSAKLAQTWNRIPVTKRLFMQLCEDSLTGILGGTARIPDIAEACRQLGFHAKEWDIKFGRVGAVMMAPVCTSFSVARDRAKVIRNQDASISPHTRRLLKKVREQTTKQKQKSLQIHQSEGLWKRTEHVCKKLIKKDWFECMISFVIVANSAIIGVDSHMSLPSTGETAKGPGLPWAAEAEIFFLVFYSVELAIRAIALQSKCLRDGWFIFDAILVTSAYIEQLLSFSNVQSEQQIMILRLLRLIRLVRTFRMIRQIKSIWRLLYGLLTCGELLISTLALLGMVIYVFAVLGLETIASNQEMREDDNIQRLLDERFSSLGVTMMTLTQFVTLDSLSSLYLPLIKKNAWLMFYFAGLIIIVSIALMNLVTAVLVEGALEHARQDRELEAKVGMVTAKQMLPGILSLFDAVDQDGSGEIVIEEMEKFEQSGLHTVPPHFLDRASVESMTELFDMLDVDKSGRINKDEFTEGILDIFLREVPLSSLQMM
ncbi:CACNA1H, partial [Symbiodinium sp. CCMP2456]